MEIGGKAHHISATMLLLPISKNPSNTYVSQSIRSRCIAKLDLAQLFILLLTLILGTFTLLGMFVSSSLIPQAPNIQLNSLFVSKFNVSNTTFGANWDATLTIENPNLVSWFRFNHIKGSILYKENMLAIKSAEPFVLGLKEQKMVRMKISTKGLEEDKPVVKEWVLDEINKQREDGAVNFSMQMFVSATYKTGWWGSQHVVMNPQCLDLKVGFLPNFGYGSWITRGPIMCS